MKKNFNFSNKQMRKKRWEWNRICKNLKKKEDKIKSKNMMKRSLITNKNRKAWGNLELNKESQMSLSSIFKRKKDNDL